MKKAPSLTKSEPKTILINPKSITETAQNQTVSEQAPNVKICDLIDILERKVDNSANH